MVLNENMIFDTHAHYDDEAFEIDREEVLNLLKNNNVCGIINAGTDIKSSEKVLELAKKWDFIYPALGIHPENLDDSCGCEELISKLVNVGFLGNNATVENVRIEWSDETFCELFEMETDLPLCCLVLE